MPATWQPRPEGESLLIISLTHSYGKENRREHCRRFAQLDVCRSCLQLMTLRNTAVYQYHSIFETIYYRPALLNTMRPYIKADFLIVKLFLTGFNYNIFCHQNHHLNEHKYFSLYIFSESLRHKYIPWCALFWKVKIYSTPSLSIV